MLKGFAPADRAQAGDLTFAENENYFARAETKRRLRDHCRQALSLQKKVLIESKARGLRLPGCYRFSSRNQRLPRAFIRRRSLPDSAQVDSQRAYWTVLRAGRKRSNWGARCIARSQSRRRKMPAWRGRYALSERHHLSVLRNWQSRPDPFRVRDRCGRIRVCAGSRRPSESAADWECHNSVMTLKSAPMSPSIGARSGQPSSAKEPKLTIWSRSATT